jgi:Beta-lactamase class C and other penicillin binding proteins
MSKVFYRMRFLVGIAATVLVAGKAAAQSPLSGLDEYISAARKDWQIPGVAVGIVHGDTVVFAKGFGVRTVGKPEKVDDHTLFAIASDTKAFTGILLAMLVDDGKLRWDAPLTTYLPTIKFGDDYLTRELTLRDALTHRSGLARADLLWTAGWSYDRGELLRRLRYLRPSWGLRSHYGYSNPCIWQRVKRLQRRPENHGMAS